MCDFNNLDDAQKLIYHRQISECAASLGGVNFFLQLLEAIRKNKPHPLIGKNSQFNSPVGSVKWNKVIFKDKFDLLLKVRVNESKRGNLLPPKDDKSYKNVMNLIRTLNPIEFVITPKNPQDGKGFTLHPFDKIDEDTTRLNPLFDALFFCAVDTVKKVLNYEQRV
jgi:hypothetical protein